MANNNNTTQRQEWFDFLDKCLINGRPEDHMPVDNHEFLQKIKLFFDNKQVVCDAKIDLSYVFFRLKSSIDHFINVDYRNDLNHLKADLTNFRDVTNKEIFDLKNGLSKTSESLNDKLKNIDRIFKHDLEDIRKEFQNNLDNSISGFLDKINETKEELEIQLSDLDSKYESEINSLKSQMETFANLTSQAVENAIAKAKEELEAEIEEVKNEIQSGIDSTYDELKEKIEKNTEDISAINNSVGQPNGIATLDENGKLTSSQLPDWTDDVIEVFAEYDVDENGNLINIELFTDYRKTDEITEGEVGKLYVDVTNDDLTYIFRWTGREWVCVNNFVTPADIVSLKSEISNIQGDVTSLQSDVENLRDTCATKDELNSAVEDLEKKIDEDVETTGGEDERITALENDVETLKSDVEANKEAIENLQESKQDKLTAGEGIDITDNVISSTVDTTLYEVVANLPTDDIDINKIYVVPVREKGHNKCTEYIYVDGRWEILGNKTNLDDYYTVEQIDAIIETINANVETNTENIAENTSSIEKNTENISSNTTKISQIEDALAELGVEVGDDESKLSTIEKQVEANTAAIETKQDKLTAGTGIAINEINGETVIACTLDTSLYIFCTVLPTTDIDPNKIYVTPSNTPGEDNVYIEWLYVDGAWEKIGELHSDMDMSDYYTKSEVDAKVTSLENSIEDVNAALETTKSDLQAAIDTNASNIETNASAIADLQESKQNNLVAGTNISLTDNADGTTTVSCEIDTACYKIVASLPEKPDDADVDKIFMIPSDDQESQNEFVEYIWVDTAWEQVGTNSYTKAQVDAIKDALQESIDTLTSTVENNNTSVTESIEKLESSIETLESSLESTKSDLQAAIDTNAANIDANKSAIETNASAIETNSNEISELSENKQDKLTAGTGISINEINGETIIECTCESTITSLQEQVNNIDSDLKTAEDAIATNTSAIETLHGDVASNASAIEELQSDVENKQDKLTAGTGIEINEINGETVIAWTEESRLGEAESNIVSNTSAIEELSDIKQDKMSAGYGIEITTDNIINVTLDTTLYKVVTVLPTQPDEEDENKIFVVPSPTQGNDNLYVEYLWVIDAWEKIGELHTEVDLSNYYTKSEIDSKVTDLQSQIDTNTSNIETNKESIETNTSSISALETKHQSDIDSLNALVSDLTGVEHADFENVQSLISGLQESVTTNTANIETLQSDVASNTSAIEELQSDVEANTTAIETKQDKLTAGTGIAINSINGETVIGCTLDTTIYEVVLTLPTENIDSNKIYVVPNLEGTEGNECKEYLYVDGAWEEIGTFKADIDLSDYYTKSEVDTKVTGLQSQIDTNTSNIETNTSAIESNTSDIEELKEQISNLEGTEISDIEALKEQVATNTSNIETNTSNIEDLKEQVDEIDDDLSIAESNIVSNTSAIETLQDSKQDKLTAGTGISINKINDETVIACTLDTDVFVVEGALPENPSEENVNKIYVVPGDETETGNRFVEYIWIGSSYVEGAWEKLGEFSADIDLSAYATTAEVKEQVDALDSKIESNAAAIETNTDSISSLESQVSTNTNAISTNASAIEDLKGRVQSAEEAIDKVSEEIGDIEASLQDAIDGVETSLNDSIDELKERLSGDEAAITSNTASIESNTSSIEELQESKQDNLTAGTGIEITSDNTINVTLDTKFCVFVDKLPETGEENKLYLVKKSGTVQSDNLFDEWIWGDETGWEYIGGINPEVDLADYYTKTQVDDMINELKNSLLNDLKPYLENISSSIETLQGDVTNIKETVEDTSDDIKIITQILAGMTGTSI